MEKIFILIVVLACHSAQASPILLSEFPFEIDDNVIETVNDIRFGGASDLYQNEHSFNFNSFSLPHVASNASAGSLSIEDARATPRPLEQVRGQENPFAAWMNLNKSEPVHSSSTAQPETEVREPSTTSTPSVSNADAENGFSSGWGHSRGNDGSVVDVSSSTKDSDCSAGSKATASTGKRSGSTVGVSATLCLTKDKLLISLTQAGSVGSRVLNNGTSKSMEFTYGNTFTMSLKLPKASEFLALPAKEIVTVPKTPTGGETQSASNPNMMATASTTLEPLNTTTNPPVVMS